MKNKPNNNHLYRRTRIRSVADAKGYGYKKAFECITEYLHLGKDLHSAAIDEDRTSVETVSLKDFQQYVCRKIDEYEDMRGNRKFGSAF